MSSITDIIPKDTSENLAWRRKLWRLGYDSEDDRQAILVACSRDLLFFINAFCWTYDPRIVDGANEIPFITYPFQDDFLLEADASVGKWDLTVPKSRAQGATWCIEAMILRRWQFRRGERFLMASKTQDAVDRKNDMDALFPKLDFMLDHMPGWMLPAYTRNELVLYNKDMRTAITGASKTKDIGRSGRPTLLFVDEFACYNAQEGDDVMKATQHSAGSRIFVSTPKGSDNTFFQICHKPSRMKRIDLHWSNHPVLRRGLYHSEGHRLVLDDDAYWKRTTVGAITDRATLIKFGDVPVNARAFEHYPFIRDGQKRSPWFDNEELRAGSKTLIAQELNIDFLGSGSPFFDPEMVQQWIEEYSRDAVAVGELSYDDNTAEPEKFEPREGGRLSLWMNIPFNGSPPEDREYVIGCDISAGSLVSNSVACVVDCKHREVVAELVTSGLSPNRFAEYAAALGKWFRGNKTSARVWFEIQGPGEPFLSRMKELIYPTLYRHTKVGGKPMEKPGWPSNPSDKYTLLTALASAYGTGAFINRSRLALSELHQYQWTPNGLIEHSGAMSEVDPSGAKKNHGDRVIANMGANHLLAGVGEPKVLERRVPHNCLQARMDRAKPKVEYW